MMKLTINKLTILLLVALFVVGCNPRGDLEETITSEQALTAIAQTVDAELATVNVPTETFTLSPTPEPSPTGTSTPTISPTAAVTATQTPQNVGLPGSTACDDSAFVSDVTIPDGTEVSTGEVFTKTWRLQNSGTCTWTSSYAVVFVDGSMMDATSPISLTVETVASGAVVDISIGMVAPDINGTFTGYWRMQNDSGVLFGVTFYVEIRVGGESENGELTPTADQPTATPTRTRRFEPRATATP